MIRHIEIDAVLNGFTVRVGCQTLVFDSVSALTDQLARYLRNPEEMEKQYAASLNALHTLGGGGVNPAPTPTTSNRDYMGGCASTDPRGYEPLTVGRV